MHKGRPKIWGVSVVDWTKAQFQNIVNDWIQQEPKSSGERYSNRNVHHFSQLREDSDAIQLYPDLPVPNICGSKLLRSHRVPKAQRLAVAPGRHEIRIPWVQQEWVPLYRFVDKWATRKTVGYFPLNPGCLMTGSLCHGLCLYLSL